MLFLKAHGRILGSGLALIDTVLPHDIARGSPLAVAWRRLDSALDDFLERQMIAA